ncbi:MAG TPA: acetylxylan esterase [Gemmatimonadales bacterium]|nr:acetylxylan esterase [Gemmatimonadales bacterium]
MIRSVASFRLLLAAPLAALLGVSAAAAQDLTFTPWHADGIYAVGERVGWTVAAAPGRSPAPGPYAYTVRRDGGAVVGSGTFDLASGGASIATSLARPGMLLVEVRPPAGDTGFRGASKSEVGRVLLGAAVAPMGIRPAASRPADFDSFWTAQIAALAAVPPQPELTPGESGRPGVEWYRLRMNNVGGAHVWGQLAKPAGAGPFPALLVYQWASPPYPLQKAWVTDRAAEGWLVLNVEPHDVPPDLPRAWYDSLPDRIKNYRLIGADNRDSSYFLTMYLGDVRAAGYLAGRPDWDGRTLVVTGISMGGQQSFAVAGLEPRVTALVVDVPAGGDALGPDDGRAASYPNWDLSRPGVRAAAPYFDAANFAPRITARSLVAMGFIDETCPPASVWAVFNRIRGPKQAVPMPDSPHNHMATPEEQAPYTSRAAEWLGVLVKGGDPTAPAGAP